MHLKSGLGVKLDDFGYDYLEFSWVLSKRCTKQDIDGTGIALYQYERK
jgi:hypothetical protein